MEIVNVMKKIALFLVVASFAVAVVACQGAVGPQGPPGADGTDGTDGTDGPSGMDGADGISPITVAAGVTRDPILLNVRSTGQTISTSTVATVDTTVYFSGGQEPILYGIVDATVMDGTTGPFFTATIDPDSGVLTVKAKSGQTAAQSAQYGAGEMVTVKATDANKVTPVVGDNPVTLTIRANKAPTVDTNLAFAVTVGTQAAADAMRDGLDADGKALTGTDIPNPICAMFASCVFTITTTNAADTAVANASFDSEGEADVSLTGDVAMVFSDDDVRGSTLSVVEYDAKYVTASATGATFTIGGVKSTFIADTNNDGTVDEHTPTPVRLRAMDANGLWVEFDVDVSVDGAPTLATTHSLNAAYSIKTDQGTGSVVPNVSRFFTDVETGVAMLTWKVTSSNRAVAEVGMEPRSRQYL